MKFGWKEYFKPTPKRFRILGDSLAAAGTFAATISIMNGNAKAGTAIMISSVFGKFFSNFFADDEVKDKPKEQDCPEVENDEKTDN